MKRILCLFFLFTGIISYGNEIEFEVIDKSKNKIKILAKTDIENSNVIISKLEEIDYNISDGDTLSDIAYERGLDWPKMARLNRLSNPHLILIGEKLVVPKTDEYSLEELEFEGSLDEVALREKISVEDLEKLNTAEEIASKKIRIVRFKK